MPKTFLANGPLFTNADLSKTLVSSSIRISHLDNISIMLAVPNTANGVFTVNAGDSTNMLPLSFGQSIAAPDPDGLIHIELTELGCSHISVTFTPGTGSSGVLNGTIEGKSLS